MKNLENSVLKILLKENRDYGSADFEADAEKLKDALDLAEAIVDSREWKDWMEASMSNHFVAAVGMNDDLRKKIASAKISLETLYDALINTDE